MRPSVRRFSLAVWMFAMCLTLQAAAGQAATATQDDSQARPPVTEADIQIVRRAGQILDSPAKWNRADTRNCPGGAKTFSLYCALEQATDEVSGTFQHRGAAMQEARFVIDDIAPDRNYEHRLMHYNNDPTTTFTDIQKVFRLLESRMAQRLKDQLTSRQAAAGQPAAARNVALSKPRVTQADLQIVKRVRQILDSPAKWNRADTQNCRPDAQTFSLFCALVMAAKEVTGSFDDGGAAIREARLLVDEAPNRKNYTARLTDYNNDPTIQFTDLQNFLRLVEERLAKRIADEP